MEKSKNPATDKAKMAAALAASALVEDDMLVGLGTGSTASFFIQSLIQRCREGLNIEVVSTSLHSENLARSGGIPIVDINALSSLDICFDGADEIDPEKRMIKGGGGALLREKIIANMSQEMIVIVDEGKCVKALGAFPLAVEICRFAPKATIALIEEIGYTGALRKDRAGKEYVTDNDNYIFDIQLSVDDFSPEYVHLSLIKLPGVVETGLFLHEAGQVIIGKYNGEVEIIS